MWGAYKKEMDGVEVTARGRKMEDVEQVEVGEGDHVVVLIVGEEGTGDGSEKG